MKESQSAFFTNAAWTTAEACLAGATLLGSHPIFGWCKKGSSSFPWSCEGQSTQFMLHCDSRDLELCVVNRKHTPSWDCTRAIFEI